MWTNFDAIGAIKNNPTFNDIFSHRADEVIKQLEKSWNEPHRNFHNIQHFNFLSEKIHELYYKSPKLTFELEIIAAFHDIVYDPKRNDNEEKSVEMFKS